ncbi:MAG: hypothetical protein ABWY56_14640, partial [Propionibacteriaceae bacterium]
APPPGFIPPTAPAAAAPKSRAGWIVAGIAVLVVLVVIATLIIRNVNRPIIDYGPAPNPTSSADVCPDAVQPSASPPPQSGSRVRSGKLSYPRLSAPFEAPRWDRRVPFGRDVESQQATVEKNAAGTPTWVADVLVARLLAGDGFYGPEQGAKLVATCITGKFYGDGEVDRADVRNGATTVDGHDAWVIESHLTFDLPDVETKGELMIVIVVDTADGEAGLLYASVPDTSPQLVAPARQALSGALVDG